MSIEQIQPATQQQASVYLPYVQGARRNFLPYAISLYQKGVLEGHRKIEASEHVPFVASWNVGTLPSDLTRCRIQFDGNAELSYELMMASFEFINFLIELMDNYKRYRITDFSQPFYRKLLRIDDGVNYSDLPTAEVGADPQKNQIKIEPGTLVLIVSLLILLPLLFIGFLSQGISKEYSTDK